MIRTQVYFPDDLYYDLKLLANTSRVRFSDLIRQGVKHVVTTNKAKRNKNWGKGFIGAGVGGPKDLSTHLDYYLYGKGRRKGME